MPDESSPQSLDWSQVKRARAGARIGKHIIYHPTLESTNALGRALLRAGAVDGAVVVTDDQTQGRGRHGRHWVAPPASGLAVSVLLRPDPDFPLYTYSMAAALAADDVVRAAVGDRCTLKWPNDVLVDGAKVAGILLEIESVAGAWAVVAGIGLNVNATPDVANATSLAAAQGMPMVERERVLIDLLAALEERLDSAVSAPDTLVQVWRDRLETLGQRVRVQVADTDVVEGVAVDVDAEGALLVRADDGTIHTLHAGDVTLSTQTVQA